MDTAISIIAKVIGPFAYPWLSTQRIYWLYLVTSILLAVGVFVLRRSERQRTGGTGLFGFLFPKAVLTHPSAVVDYKFFIVNAIGFALFISPFLLASPPIAALTTQALSPPLGGAPWVTPSTAYHILYTVCMILALDAAVFAGHYLQHKVPMLWEFHKVHHSAAVLTPITVYRMHPVDDILTGVIAAITAGLVDGVFGSIYQASPVTVLLFDLNVFLFLFYFAGYNLRHSHVWLSYPAPISHVLISPAQHQIHHSSDPKHFDKNLGFIFAFWDWLVGTLYVPKEREDLQFGLDGDEHLAFDSVGALYLRPFRAVFRDHLRLRRQS